MECVSLFSNFQNLGKHLPISVCMGQPFCLGSCIQITWLTTMLANQKGRHLGGSIYIYIYTHMFCYFACAFFTFCCPLCSPHRLLATSSQSVLRHISCLLSKAPSPHSQERVRATWWVCFTKSRLSALQSWRRGPSLPWWVPCPHSSSCSREPLRMKSWPFRCEKG